MPVTVLADDLTGACEIAGIGLNHGLRSIVSMNLQDFSENHDLVVLDTETRLDSPARAAVKLGSVINLLKGAGEPGFLFKKVDSVLRGPIPAELKVLVKGLGYERVLLVPGNPALGRTIKDGFYRIDGVPLHKTGFANDPHHPVHSSRVVDILGNPDDPPVHSTSVGGLLPETGLIAGDVGRPEDFLFWRGHITPGTLPAGAAAFFRSVLEHWVPRKDGGSPEPVDPGGPVLLVSGTTSPDQIRILENYRMAGGECVPITFKMLEKEEARVQEAIAETLARRNRALVYMSDATRADPANAGRVRSGLARVARPFVMTGGIRHLVVEGGATAASIACELDWRVFEAVREWAQGIVSLRPSRISSGILYTVKPGSYPWPTTIERILFPLKDGASDISPT